VLLNDSGQVAFQGSKPGATGLFVGTGTGLPQKVVITGDPAPNGTINGVQAPSRFNAAGQVAYVAMYPAPPGPPFFNGSAVFLGAANATPHVVAKAGDPAPGITGGYYLGDFQPGGVDLNSSGQVAFWDDVTDFSSFWTTGWFLGSGTAAASPRLLQNQPLPGGGQASMVSPGNGIVALADSGEMAMYIAEVNNSAIMPRFIIAGTNGTLRSFAGSGERAAGTGSDFGKLTLPVRATPLGRFLFGAILLNGPAEFGLFEDKR